MIIALYGILFVCFLMLFLSLVVVNYQMKELSKLADKLVEIAKLQGDIIETEKTAIGVIVDAFKGEND